ncbi:TetR/AcrR family transcriptional regulator [Pendulispora rubella]|uniref:TetR/AcrR family transcriptional regulator n=1 Tax=Pendulispora rubella TaxID=2741070 RepID=A0ABZ2KWH8_9BACT
MRYPAGHREHSRERIIEAAASLFRSRGITNTGIDAVMSAVGLTAGGFYAHFKSKQHLIGEVVKKAFVDGQARLHCADEDRRAWMEAVLRRYISRSHRDHPDQGCPMVTMLSELPHAHEVVQPIIKDEVEKYAGLFEKRLGEGPEGAPTARQRALGAIALMVGAVSVARVLRGSKLSDEVLAAARAVGLSLVQPETNET